jgi:hypothetical protein
MRLQQYFTFLLTAPLLVALSNEESFAFYFTMPPQQPDSPCTLQSRYCLSMSYTQAGLGTITTDIKPVSSLKLGGTDKLFSLLSSSVWAKNGWTFNRATKDLMGSFNISIYAPFVIPKTGNIPVDNVGAEIKVLYKPVVGKDPVDNQVHFIQRIFDNHAIISTLSGPIDLGHGSLEDRIDTMREQTDTKYIQSQQQIFNPFYDTYGRITRDAQNNTILFQDLSNRIDMFDNHDWSAELYVVRETAPKTVTIYNGISWGWKNTYTPPKVSSSPKPNPTPLPCNGGGGSGGGGCIRASSVQNLLQELPLSDFDSGEVFVPPESVPEPTTILGILGIGVWGAALRLKRKNHKQ